MKNKLLALLLAITMVITLVSCSGTEEKGNSTTQEKSVTDQDNEIQKSIFDENPSGFRVITVGTGNPKLSLTNGGASTLVQYKDKYFLVDCGFNSIATLMKLGLPCENIENMLFTHQHNDHNADFWTFFIAGWGSPTGRRSLNLVGPGVQELYETTINFYNEDLSYRSSLPGYGQEGIYKNVEIMNLTEESYSIEIDGVKITSIPVPHTISTYAYRFEAGGESIVISGDLTYTDNFAEFAKGADILVMDGMLTSDFSDLPENAREGMKASLSKSHIKAEEIGKIATDAGCKNLVLTHLGVGNPSDTLRSSYTEMGYEGKVTFAEDGMVIEP